MRIGLLLKWKQLFQMRLLVFWLHNVQQYNLPELLDRVLQKWKRLQSLQ